MNAKQIRLTLLIILSSLLLFSAGCSPSVTSEATPEATPVPEKKEISPETAALISDVNAVRDTIKASLLGDTYDDSKFDEIIVKLESGDADREYCIHAIQEIISDCKCAHASIYTLMDDELYIKRLPLVFNRFEEGYYVVIADEKYSDLLGMKLTGIAAVENGESHWMTIEEAEKKVATLMHLETESGLRRALESTLFETDCKWLGLLDENNNICISLENGEGKLFEVSLPFVDSFAMNLTYLVETDSLPSYYRNSRLGHVFCYDSDAENGIMYFQYYSCMEMEGYNIVECIDNMLAEMNAYGTFHTLVIDVRFNGGGNRGILQRGLLLRKAELEKYNIVMLNSGETYSAAMQASEDCLDHFSNVKIYGEETGQSISDLTQVEYHEFEKLHCGLGLPTVEDILPSLVGRAKDAKKGVIPDVYVVQKFSDYINGIDTCYAKIAEDY